MNPLLAERKTLLPQLGGQSKGWILSGPVEVKASPEFMARLDLNTAQITNLRDVARSAFGLQHASIDLYQEINLVATVATGLVNTVVTLNPTGAAEYGSVSALFTEIRTLGGDYVWSSSIVSPYAIGATAISAAGGFLVLTYDPVEVGAITTAAAAFDMPFKQITPLPVVSGNGASTGAFNGMRKSHGIFVWQTEKGLVTQGTSVQGTDEWQAIDGAPTSVGFLKPFALGGEVTARNVVAGIMRFRCQFRNRD